MRSASFIALAAACSPAMAAVYKGFSTGATFSDGRVKIQSDFEGEFRNQQQLQFTDGTFSSARLYTMVQGGTGGPIAAIPAAVATKTHLLLGLWASAGQAAFEVELQALRDAIGQYGTAFTDLIAGISVGSEDVYRTTELGIASKAGTGATPDQIVNYIGQVRDVIANTPASSKPVGHVDTYNVYTNSSNQALIPACDFLGVDAYPYYESAKANSIENAAALFFDDLAQTAAVAQGIPIWITETGWPISGPQMNQGIASPENAARYYKEVGCKLFSTGYNTWWFIYQDNEPVAPASGVSFAVAGAGNPPPTVPLYSLAC